MMSSSNYIGLPEATLLLNHLKTINPEYGIEIILPKKEWPGLKSNLSPQAMAIIHEHHKVFKNASGNDFGLKFIIGASASADLWIHILDENNNIIGFSTNQIHEVDKLNVNFFRTTFLNKIIQGVDIHPFMQNLKLAVLPADIIIARTQHPIIYKNFKTLCTNHGMIFNPTVDRVSSEVIDIGNKLGLNIDEESICRGVIQGEVLIKTPAIPKEIAPLWNKMNLKNGDVLFISGYKKNLF